MTATAEIRDALTTTEMVRVYLSGRLAERGAVSFVGYPKVRRFTVTLFGTDRQPKATVRLRAIRSVERVTRYRQGGKKKAGVESLAVTVPSGSSAPTV